MLPSVSKARAGAVLLRLVLLALWCSMPLARAQDLAPVPPLTGHVVDLTGTLTQAQQQGLDARLRDFERRKGSQVALLIVPRTAPETIEQYGIRVAEQWKLGRSKVDDGAILLVAKDERALRIEVGYGLEGALNDATARRIVDERIVPYFRSGDFAGGMDAGVDAILKVIDGEPLPAPAADTADAGPLALLPFVLFAALMLSGLMRALLGRGKGAFAAAGVLGVGAWLLSGTLLMAAIAAFVGFVVTLAGGQMGRGWQGGYRGTNGGWGSGGGSGGFRGGGGGFGGGGASGRW